MHSLVSKFGLSLKCSTRFFLLALLLAGLSGALSVFSVVGAQIPADAKQTCSVNCTASAGLDQVTPGAEFQKADCAARNTLGDGVVGLHDYIQAGRYSAALDPPMQVGGPTAPAVSSIPEATAIRNVTSEAQQNRTIRIPAATITRGQNGNITIEYEAVGDEARVGLSVNFDTTQLTFVSMSSSATFLPKLSEAPSGRVGFIVVAGIGQTFPAGTQTLASITFNAKTSGTESTTSVTLGSNPIPVQVVLGDASNVPPDQITLQNGMVTLIEGRSGENPTPVITSLSPNSVQAGSGEQTLTVNGTNFASGAEVRVNGTPRTTNFVSADRLTATILAADVASGPGPTITVFNPAPDGGTSNGVVLQLTTHPVPTITSINPLSTVAGSAAFDLVLTGTNFISSSQVLWNTTELTVTLNSPNQLTASVPASLVASMGTGQCDSNEYTARRRRH